MQLTPMMQQYRRIKRETPPSILMFRLGDFYEMFFDDAVTASRVLGITLTAREAGKGNKVPMCGVPYHAAQEHIARLIRAGHKVAVCDQMEDPGLAKGLVKREVTRVVTPGTAIDEGLLGERDNNYLAAIHRAGGIFGLCCLDLSTGEFLVTELEREADLMGEIGRLSPSEFLLPAELAGDREFVARLRGISAGLVNQCDDWLFEREGAPHGQDDNQDSPTDVSVGLDVDVALHHGMPGLPQHGGQRRQREVRRRRHPLGREQEHDLGSLPLVFLDRRQAVDLDQTGATHSRLP